MNNRASNKIKINYDKSFAGYTNIKIRKQKEEDKSND